jgi:hypothetical protein
MSGDAKPTRLPFQLVSRTDTIERELFDSKTRAVEEAKMDHDW